MRDAREAPQAEPSTPAASGPAGGMSAEERLRRSWSSLVWTGIILSAGVHFLVFNFWPTVTAADVSVAAGELELEELPPEVEIPPPPEAIARPAVPVVAEGVEIDEEITIAPTTFEDNPVSELPPPKEDDASRTLAEAPTFTPYTVRPDVRNRGEVQKALEQEYPPLLRDAGIGGTVLVWFFIDEEGRVQRTQVRESSGHKALDRAAIAVSHVFRFSPALNRDKRVPVWIAMPIIFNSR